MENRVLSRGLFHVPVELTGECVPTAERRGNDTCGEKLELLLELFYGMHYGKFMHNIAKGNQRVQI